MKKIVSKHDHDFENNLFYPNLSHQHQEVRQQQNIFLLQIQLLWNPHFRAPVCFAIFHCSQLHSAFFRNEMFHSNGSSQISDSLTGNTFSSPGLSTVARKMCPDADCADIVCNFPLLYVQRYAPVHGPQRVRIHPLGRRNVLAARQIAAVRVFGFWKNSFSGSMTSIFPRFIQLTVSQRRYTSSRLCDTKMTGFPGLLQMFVHLLLQLPFQIGIER